MAGKKEKSKQEKIKLQNLKKPCYNRVTEGRETLENPKMSLLENCMTAAKVENYTAEQTAKMVSDYVANPTQTTVEALATVMGKTARSIIAKLSREKVYVKKVYKTKTGETSVSKEEYADYIGEALGMGENDISSLTKANKVALRLIKEFIEAEKEPETTEAVMPEIPDNLELDNEDDE